VVWAARHRASGHERAIKFLLPERASGFPLIRFKREFRTARRIDHPNCVRVYELSERDGLWFFSMERVVGENLRRSAKHRRDPVTVVQVALQVLAALDRVHGQAIVHRDIKPHNILIGSPVGHSAVPTVKVTDFGIAKVGDLDDDERLASVLGTLRYMAPELVTDGVADARCDLYSLGVTMFEALTGAHPLVNTGQPNSLRNWHAIVAQQAARPIRAVAADVPEALAAVIDRLLQRDPQTRYRSAAEVHGDLAAWLAGAAGETALPPTPELTGRPYLAAPRLVGRAQEQKQIAEFLRANLADADHAQERPTPLLLLCGAPGQGKSRLLTWLLGQALQYGPRLLIGHGRSEIGGPFELLGPIVDGLRQAHGPPGEPSPQAAETATAMPRAPRSPLWVASPSHGGLGEPGRPKSGSGPSSSGQSTPASGSAAAAEPLALNQVLHEYTELLLDHVEDSPTLIIVEDLQWGDYETLELLRRWVRAVDHDRNTGRHLPVAFVAACRPPDEGSELAELRRSLISEGALRQSTSSRWARTRSPSYRPSC
jgi:hypothetical protein